MIKSIEQVATSLVKWLMPLCLLTVVPAVVPADRCASDLL